MAWRIQLREREDVQEAKTLLLMGRLDGGIHEPQLCVLLVFLEQRLIFSSNLNDCLSCSPNYFPGILTGLAIGTQLSADQFRAQFEWLYRAPHQIPDFSRYSSSVDPAPP